MLTDLQQSQKIVAKSEDTKISLRKTKAVQCNWENNQLELKRVSELTIVSFKGRKHQHVQTTGDTFELEKQRLVKASKQIKEQQTLLVSQKQLVQTKIKQTNELKEQLLRREKEFTSLVEQRSQEYETLFAELTQERAQIDEEFKDLLDKIEKHRQAELLLKIE